MPSVEQNLQLWNERYDWSKSGDEWSNAWGGTDTMWQNSLYPRIKQFLPAKTILEIAPGFGRCTQYLKNYCERLIVVDLSPRCIEACKKRFAADSHISYHVNDGSSLDMIADRSIDFVFSFDSLVHVQANVMEAYVKQLGSKLKDTGWGFLHHSNLGSYRGIRLFNRYINKLGPIGEQFRKSSLAIDPVWRGDDMTAGRFNDFCEKSGLHCTNQELINWANKRYLIDSMSIFTADKKTGASRVIKRNPDFMDEVNRCRAQAEASSPGIEFQNSVSPIR